MKWIAGKVLEPAFAQVAEDREEYRKVFLLFLYLLFVASASTVGRTAADALFLTRFDASALSMMYLPQSAALLLAGIAFQRFALRVRIDRFLYRMIPSIALLVVVSGIGVVLGHAWVLPVIYVGYDVFNFLMIVCFWQLATAVLDQRKVKRTIGIVGSGGIVGGILSGFGLKLIVPLVGTANLIWFYAALQALALAAVYTLVRRSGDPAAAFAASGKPAQAAPSSAKKERKAEGLFRSVPHLKYVAVMSAALVLVLTFVDYQFKIILRSELQNEALAGFMGSFHGFAGLLALAVQMFVAGKVLTRFGVTTAILVFPAILLAGSAGVLLFPVLAMAVVVKGSDKVVGDTINASVNQLIMFPIPPQWRSRAKSVLDGIVRNGAKGLAGLCLIAFAPLLSARDISYVVIALLVVCIAAAIKVKSAYLKTLLSAMQTDDAKFDVDGLDVMDPASLRLLTAALRSTDKQQALYAFRVLCGVEGFDVAPHIPELLRHPSREVVVEALSFVERNRLEGVEAELSQLLVAGEGPVRAQALMTLAAYGKEEELERISRYLDDADLELRCGAIAGLVKHYGIEGMFRAVGVLKQLLDSADEGERAAVAGLFGKIGEKLFYKPLIPLLQDPSPRVRREALRSAGALQAAELVGYIVPMLRRGDARKAAIEALAAYDEADLLPLLAPWFEREPAPLHLPKVFERLGTQAAFDMLLRVYAPSGFEMKNRLAEALHRMRRGVKVDEKLTAAAESLVLQECELYGALNERQAELEAVPAYREAAEVGGQLRAATAWRVFQLLALLYDAAAIRAVYANWSEGDARQQANAMEAIDQLTRGPVRIALAKLMNARKPAANAAVSPSELEDRLAWWNGLNDEWLRQVIRYVAFPEANPELKEHMERIRLLRSYSMFRELTSRELSDVGMKLHETTMARGERIFEGSGAEHALFLIRSGTVGFYRDGVKVGERKAGESFGQAGLLTRRERTAEARAEEDGLLWKLSSDDFYEVMFDRSSIAIEMMKQLSRRLRSVLAQRQASGPRANAAASTANAGTETDAEAAAAVAARSGAGSSDSLLRRVLILQKIDLFSHLAEADLLLLAQMVDEVAYEAGEAVCRVGEYGDALFGIIEGEVRVHRGEQTFAVLGEGDYFGEMAIIDSGPRSADCTAEVPTVLLQLHRDRVFSLCFQNMDVLRNMMQVMGDRLQGMSA